MADRVDLRERAGLLIMEHWKDYDGSRLTECQEMHEAIHAALRAVAVEAAKVPEMMVVGGRMWTEEQSVGADNAFAISAAILSHFGLDPDA